MFTDYRSIGFSVVLILLMVIAPKGRGVFRRYKGHEPMRLMLGLISYFLGFSLWRFKAVEAYSISFMAFILFFVWLNDYTYGLWLKEHQGREGLLESIREYMTFIPGRKDKEKLWENSADDGQDR